MCLVDDSLSVRIMTALILMMAGYDLLTAPDGAAAVSLHRGSADSAGPRDHRWDSPCGVAVRDDYGTYKDDMLHLPRPGIRLGITSTRRCSAGSSGSIASRATQRDGRLQSRSRLTGRCSSPYRLGPNTPPYERRPSYSSSFPRAELRAPCIGRGALVDHDPFVAGLGALLGAYRANQGDGAGLSRTADWGSEACCRVKQYGGRRRRTETEKAEGP
jgi:hypothetical protein